MYSLYSSEITVLMDGVSAVIAVHPCLTDLTFRHTVYNIYYNIIYSLYIPITLII